MPNEMHAANYSVHTSIPWECEVHCIHAFPIINICGCPAQAISFSCLQASCAEQTTEPIIYSLYIAQSFMHVEDKATQTELLIHGRLNQLHHASIFASQTPLPFLPPSKGVVRLEIFHKLWSLSPFATIFALTSGGSSCGTPLCCSFIFLVLFEGRVGEDVSQELCPPEGIGERQVTLRCVILHLPHEFVREGPVVVLLYFCVQLLHPPDPDEEARKVTLRLLPKPPLHTVPKLAIAVLLPELVNGAEILRRDELDLREEDIPSTPCGLTSKVNEECTGGLVSLAVVPRSELAAEEVNGWGWR